MADTPEWELRTKPYRHYRYDGKATTPSGLKIASVTQILGVLDNPALIGWAANVTAEGAWKLMRDPKFEVPKTWRALQAELKKRGLDHRSTTRDAQDRGTTVHQMLEDWIKERKIPSVQGHPEHWHGYVRAITAYILWAQGQGVEFESSETIVGSLEYGYAGTCDTVTVTRGSDGKRTREDLKTSRQVYARKHFRQLEGYEHAAVEGGAEPTDERWIVALHLDGTFERVRSIATAKDFLNVVAVWRDDQPLKKHEDDTYKAKRKREKAAA